MTARFLIGDVFDRLAEIPDGSVDLVVTSPPFLALRSYLPADHPDKAKEIGSEATPADFLDTLLELTTEWRRVLAPHGSICVELGDTYSDSGGSGGDYNAGGLRDGQGRFAVPARRGGEWPMAKSLCGIPSLYAWSIAYGRNLLRSEHTIEPWRVRNLLCWARPNPPVGALGDKWRPATSYVTVACVGRDRYFDLDAVRLPGSPNTNARVAKGVDRRERTAKTSPDGNRSTLDEVDTAGAPPLDWLDERDIAWQPLLGLPTAPYAGAHYATFPSALPARLIECMCPQRVCTVCGEPSRRIVERDKDAMAATSRPVRADSGGRTAKNGKLTPQETSGVHIERTITRTVAWTDCGHDAWRPGLVLDPFGGSGTTGAAATGAGRDCVLIDIDERNADLARERVGMWLEVAS